jgi:hypothetical protein
VKLTLTQINTLSKFLNLKLGLTFAKLEFKFFNQKFKTLIQIILNNHLIIHNIKRELSHIHIINIKHDLKFQCVNLNNNNNKG